MHRMIGLFTCYHLQQHLYMHWAIPENIHTIPRTALRISEGEGGFTIMEF